MNKLLLLISAMSLVQVSSAISLGDKLDPDIAIQNNTTTSKTERTEIQDKYYVFKTVAAPEETTYTYLVNKDNVVYSIKWSGNKALNSTQIQQIFGKYYPKYQQASAKPANDNNNSLIQRFHFRKGISLKSADGKLEFSQYGSMLSGISGSATIHDLEPK